MALVTYTDPIILNSTGQDIVTQLTRLANTQEYTAGTGIDINNLNEISVKVASTSQLGGVKVDGSTITSDANGVISANVSDKADKVASATADDFATLDSNGNLTDSGISKDIVPSGATSSNKLATANDVSPKANKVVSGVTVGDFASLDANGDLTDSGVNSNIIPSGATSSNKLATANDIPTELNDLSDDVVITTPVNNQILAYNSTSGKWENKTGQAAIGGVVFKGSILFANLPTTGMENGDWYDIKDAFTTDSTFEEGSGIACAAGTDVIWVSSDSKWNILTPSGVYSFNGRVGAVSPATGDYDADQIDYSNTVSGLTADDVQEAIDELVTKKADKVSGATSGNFAGLDANGNLTDSGKKASDFSTVTTRQSPTSGGTTLSLVNTGDMYTWNNKVDSVSVGSTGTASGTAVAYQRIGVADAGGSVNYTEIAGTKYMELTQNIQSANVFTFSNSAITTSSVIDYYTSDFSVQPSNVSVTTGQCVVTVPAATSSKSLTVRIYIK